MRLSFGFGTGDGPASDGRASRMPAVLAAARRTALYGPLIAKSASGKNEHAPDAALMQVAPVAIQTYLQNKEQFRNPKAPPGATRKDPGDPVESICGSLEELLRLAARIGAGEAAMPASARRLVVRTSLGDRLAPDRARDYLWRIFELPLFEELRGSEGELLAAECEAHTGMHLEDAKAIFEVSYGELVVTSLVAVRYPVIRLRTGWVGAIGRSACPCGETAARFVPVSLAETVVRKPPSAARANRTPARPIAATAAR
jgi:hypothetical protein